GEGRRLKVKPPDRSRNDREGMVVLDELDRNSAFRECAGIIGFGKEATIVREFIRNDLQNAIEFQPAKLRHFRTPPRNGSHRTHRRRSSSHAPWQSPARARAIPYASRSPPGRRS